MSRNRSFKTIKLVNIISNCSPCNPISLHELTAELALLKGWKINWPDPYYGLGKVVYNEIYKDCYRRIRGWLDLQPSKIRFFKKDRINFYYGRICDKPEKCSLYPVCECGKWKGQTRI